MSNPLLQAKGLHKEYLMGRFPVHVLRGASLDVQPGEFVAVMGASGSGKSTLLHIVGALDLPDKGSVTYKGRNLFGLSRRERERIRNSDIGFVFQFYHLLPELNLFENILLPRMVGTSIPGWAGHRTEARETTRQIIEEMGLSHRVRHRPNELSGGERQRAAIARALVNQPPLLLADEPTGNLDATTGGEILDLLGRLNQEGQTIVMVTHDANVAARAHRAVELADGRIRKSTAAG
jgi:ABC-type lipoprotein export system ATPase subunit